MWFWSSCALSSKCGKLFYKIYSANDITWTTILLNFLFFKKNKTLLFSDYSVNYSACPSFNDLDLLKNPWRYIFKFKMLEWMGQWSTCSFLRGKCVQLQFWALSSKLEVARVACCVKSLHCLVWSSDTYEIAGDFNYYLGIEDRNGGARRQNCYL